VGTGTVSFVQNHPYEEDRVIAYAAPEGDEVAVYTRGSGRLEAGEARVPLGETFRYVCNPDVGLTAHVTPRGGWADLYVVSVSTEELVVAGRDGAGDAAFDYIVYGLRLGFEELGIVQAKERDAFPPTLETIQSDYEGHPELRSFSALERHRRMRVAMGETGELDLSGARELMAALEEQRSVALARAAEEAMDPSLDAAAAGDPPPSREGRPAESGSFANAGEALPGSQEGDRRRVPVDEEGNVYGKSFRPSSTDMASLVEVSEPVEAGDVLVIDARWAGVMSLARSAEDSAVFGVVATEPGVVLGSDPVGDDPPPSGLDEGSGAPPGAGPEETSGDGIDLRVPVAVSGVVLCKVDAGYGGILPGDLLTTSPTAGHAMRADRPAAGTILGKALEPLDHGTGLIRVLVTLR
jgi:hypothetical protein